MITRTEIEQLAAYQHAEAPVISFFMDIDKGRPDEAKWSIRLKNLLNRLEEGRGDWTDAQYASIQADMERIRQFVRDQRVAGARGIAIFASSAGELWHTYAFPNRVGNNVRVNHTTYVRPLLRMLDRYRPQCVVLVSQDQGRLFMLTGDTGETIEERGSLVSDVPRRHDQGGWSQANLQRRHDDAVRQHLKKTADMVFTVFQQMPFERLLIGGTDTIVSEFQSLLHPYLRERLVGSFAIPISATPKTVQDRARPILRALDSQRQYDLVKQLEDQVNGGEMGAAGLDGTLEALRRSQVATLLMAENFSAPGQRCTQCDSLFSRASGQCPACGGRLVPLDDIAEEMVDQALGQDAQVVVVTSPAALTRLEPQGHVGALLRFAIQPTPETA